MQGLNIQRKLNEETRKQGVWARENGDIVVRSLHILDSEVIITDNSDYTKIYAIYSLDYFNAIDE